MLASRSARRRPSLDSTASRVRLPRTVAGNPPARPVSPRCPGARRRKIEVDRKEDHVQDNPLGDRRLRDGCEGAPVRSRARRARPREARRRARARDLRRPRRRLSGPRRRVASSATGSPSRSRICRTSDGRDLHRPHPPSGHAARTIAEIAEEVEADLIVVGTHGYGRVAGLLLGSVTQGLLHAGVCPVLAVPTGAPVERPSPSSKTARPVILRQSRSTAPYRRRCCGFPARES